MVNNKTWAKGTWASIFQVKLSNLLKGMVPFVVFFGKYLSNHRLHLQCADTDIAQILICQTHIDPLVMHVITLIRTIENRYKGRQSTYACFVDMKKAFDSVNRTRLLDKLRTIGINDNIYFDVKTIYDNMSCAVHVNGIYTDWFAVDLGVKQGCILSPTLFSSYINHLAKAIKELDCGIVMENYKLNILLFADDIALIADSPQSLQHMLDTLSKWCSKW